MPKLSTTTTPTATLAGLMLAAAGSFAAADNQTGATSAYSTLNWDENCTVTGEPTADAPEENWIQLRCDGYGGLPVHVADDNGRMSLSYGHQSEKTRHWNSFAGFNEVHDTIEWRLHDTGGELRPFATIHRWLVGSAGTESERRAVLVVSTVANRAAGKSCDVGYVDATLTPDANTLAREIADTLAPNFACGRDRAQWHGNSDAGTPER
ncbi:hypothetical protein [Fodinicurvata sp. EGI_FJ10296]|uniref:hypothetical protein n=1 Tax=Fodinicurvata sp. EGI_FJ10296 TaxID=3231908 RepID=UPI0034537F4C